MLDIGRFSKAPGANGVMLPKRFRLHGGVVSDGAAALIDDTIVDYLSRYQSANIMLQPCLVSPKLIDIVFIY